MIATRTVIPAERIARELSAHLGVQRMTVVRRGLSSIKLDGEHGYLVAFEHVELPGEFLDACEVAEMVATVGVVYARTALIQSTAQGYSREHVTHWLRANRRWGSLTSMHDLGVFLGADALALALVLPAVKAAGVWDEDRLAPFSYLLETAAS